jgi:hypothetical protein
MAELADYMTQGMGTQGPQARPELRPDPQFNRGPAAEEDKTIEEMEDELIELSEPYESGQDFRQRAPVEIQKRRDLLADKIKSRQSQIRETQDLSIRATAKDHYSQGLTMGGYDEAASLGQSPQETRDMRDLTHMRFKENPWTAMGSDIAGGATSGGLASLALGGLGGLATGAARGKKVMDALNKYKKLTQLAKIGAIGTGQAAATGYLSEHDPEKRMQSAVDMAKVGGGISLGLGAAAPLIASKGSDIVDHHLWKNIQNQFGLTKNQLANYANVFGEGIGADKISKTFMDYAKKLGVGSGFRGPKGLIPKISKEIESVGEKASENIRKLHSKFAPDQRNLPMDEAGLKNAFREVADEFDDKVWANTKKYLGNDFIPDSKGVIKVSPDKIHKAIKRINSRNKTLFNTLKTSGTNESISTQLADNKAVRDNLRKLLNKPNNIIRNIKGGRGGVGQYKKGTKDYFNAYRDAYGKTNKDFFVLMDMEEKARMGAARKLGGKGAQEIFHEQMSKQLLRLPWRGLGGLVNASTGNVEGAFITGLIPEVLDASKWVSGKFAPTLGKGMTSPHFSTALTGAGARSRKVWDDKKKKGVLERSAR